MSKPVQKKTADAEREMRRRKVAANLLAGLTYRQMAEALGVSVGTVAADVRRIINQWRKEQTQDTDSWMQIQLRRLDTMLNAIWNKVLEGDIRAEETALHIIERQSSLIGLDKQIAGLVASFDVRGGGASYEKIDADGISEDDVRVILAIQEKIRKSSDSADEAAH